MHRNNAESKVEELKTELQVANKAVKVNYGQLLRIKNLHTDPLSKDELIKNWIRIPILIIFSVARSQESLIGVI